MNDGSRAAPLSAVTLLRLGEITSKADHIARIPYPDFGAAVDARSLALCAAANTALARLRLSRGLTDALHRACAVDRRRIATSRGDRAFANLAAVLDDVAAGDALATPSVATVAAIRARLVAGLDAADGAAPPVPAQWQRDLDDAFRDVGHLSEREPAVRVLDAFRRAVTIHLSTLRHQPFGSANGRTARVLEIAALVRGGLPLRVSGMLACWYVEDTRRHHAIVRQALARDDVDGFLDYAVAGLVSVLRDELEHLHQPLWMRQQALYVWREYVASHFAGDSSAPAARRRELASALPANGTERDGAFTTSDGVRDLYAHVDHDERVADLDALSAMQLVTLDGGLVIPRFDRVPRWIAPF